MNRAQAVVLSVAVCNLIVMLTFPPYDALSFGKAGIQSFDAFYLALNDQPNKLVNSNLLLLELYWVIINSAIAWLLLRGSPAAEPGMSRRTAVIIFVAANMVFVFLFPPFENYASTLRAAGTHFDGFYFVFGDKWQRRFFMPLLYMEVLWILINGALMWLLMREPGPIAEEER
jgi:hypothetical protein